MKILFNKPYLTGKEQEYISQIKSYCGDGSYTRNCHDWLEKKTGSSKALLTQSCTAALEIAAMLIDTQPGDEIIMPSYTFVSTANAFVLRGGIPVFIDIRSDTLNIDETLIEDAITNKTKAIVPVHYAGIACDMDAIMNISTKHNLYVVEDAAQGILAEYKGRALGSIGNFGAYSFHASKNISCGEGGALLVNDSKDRDRAEIIREKGTDRSRFFRGQVDKYTWQSIGSSYLPNELTAAFLLAQLEHAELITQQRIKIWNYYHRSFEDLELQGLIRRPTVPNGCKHNAHIYYIVVPDVKIRNDLISYLESRGIQAYFHYIPLHSSPAGKKYGRPHGSLPRTEYLSECLLRLPMFTDMNESMVDMIVNAIFNKLTNTAAA